MRGFFVYVLFGFCWQLFALYGHGEASVRVREKIAAADARQRSYLIAGLLLGVLLWPVGFFMAFGGPLVPRAWTKYIATTFRRTYLDRDDLFKPQMPAARCPTCDAATDRIQTSCSKCSVAWDIDHCAACCTQECFIHRLSGWTCPPCSPQPVPVPISDTRLVADGEVHVVALACVDCDASMGVVGPSRLSPDEVAAFEAAHRGHRIRGAMSDGRAVAVGPGGGMTTEVKP